MNSRVGMISNEHMIEFCDTEDGLKKCIEYRKNNPEFKGKHIHHYIQAYNLPTEKLMDFDYVDSFGGNRH
jgi:hypothetical protein